MAETNPWVRLGKKILLGAVGVGLEEAGLRVCGPTAWKYLEKVFEPVVAELKTRFPRIFDSAEQNQAAVQSLEQEPRLQQLLAERFAGLETGQSEVLRVLAQQDQRLTALGQAVDSGFQQSGAQLDRVLELVLGRLDELARGQERLLSSAAGVDPVPLPEPLDPQQALERASRFQIEGQLQLEAGDLDAAQARLELGGAILRAAQARWPAGRGFQTALGFLEKTRGLVELTRGNAVRAVEHFSEAGRAFGAALIADSRDAGALNGLANVALLHGEYDRAVAWGRLALALAPRYSAALWDLAQALEEKSRREGWTPEIKDLLRGSYQRLLEIRPGPAEGFSAQNLEDIETRLVDLG